MALITVSNAHGARRGDRNESRRGTAQLGPRPRFLVGDMTDSPLKREMQACAARLPVDDFTQAAYAQKNGNNGLSLPDLRQRNPVHRELLALAQGQRG